MKQNFEADLFIREEAKNDYPTLQIFRLEDDVAALLAQEAK